MNMNRTRNRTPSRSPVALAIALLLTPSFALAEQPDWGVEPASGSESNQQKRLDPKTIPYLDQIIITPVPEHDPAFGKPLSAAFIQQISDLAGVRLTYVRNGGGYHLFQLPKKGYEAEAEALCEKIRHDKRIKWCTPNFMVQLESPTNPNDLVYANGEQWNLGNEAVAGINAVSAWGKSVGSSSTVIAILDSGIVPHVDISATRLLPGYDFISDATSAADGNGRDADPADPGDWSATAGCNATSSWHGTAVTGVIGATTDNGIGIAGINQAAKLLPVRAIGKCKSGTQQDLVDAMKWAAGLAVTGVPANANPAKVLNISSSIQAPCSTLPLLQAAVDAVRKKGVVVVAAAGNDDGVDTSQRSPASCNGVITVGSVTRLGSKGQTTTGTRIDIAAPGAAASNAALDKIPTTSNAGTQGPVGDDKIAGWYGTSIATPHVSGIVSLMQGVSPKMRPNQIAHIIKKTARPFPTNIGEGVACTTSTCGAGILDGAAVVSAAKARIKGGLYHTVSTKADGTVWAWGFNGNGQLGGGTVGASVTAPVQLAGLSDIVGVGAGGYHTASVKQDGSVWTWGYNANGRLGDGTTVQKTTPIQVGGLTDVAEVVAGDAHTLALKRDGTVWAWGYNFFGQLGRAPYNFTDSTTPVQVYGLTDVIAIAAGGKRSMALKKDGTVWAWGALSNVSADGTTASIYSAPLQVAGLADVVAIAAGGSAVTGSDADVSLALTADGQLYAWGSNDWGELGIGTLVEKFLPTLVSALAGKNIISMDTSGSHVVVLTDDSKQWAWGLGSSGQLGDGLSGNEPGQTYSHYSATPIASATGLANVLDVAVGGAHTIALNADLTYSAWGANSGGRLGNGNTTLQSNPVPILGTGGTGVYTALEASAVKTDVQVSVSSAPNPVVAGQNITYTVGVSNVGTTAASNVKATVVLPAEASFVSASAGCVYSANVGAVTCTIASLGAATSVSLQVVGKIADAGNYSAVASTSFDGTDSSTANNVAGTQWTVTAATPTDGDVPIPAWALVMLGAGLLGAMRKKAG